MNYSLPSVSNRGCNYNLDDYNQEYDYEGDSYRDDYRADDYGEDYGRKRYMGNELTSSYKFKDHRVVEYRGDKRMSHSTNLEPGGGYYQHADTSKHSVNISDSNSGSISVLKNPEYLKRQSSSMFNFAAKLNCLLFTEEERRRSNVSGSQGKLQLDPCKVFAIRDATFATYPTDIQSKDVMWRNCIKAIDEMNRRLHRKY